MEKIIAREKPPRNISIKRTLIIFVATVFALFLVAYIDIGIDVDYADDILYFVLFLSILNSLMWPILTRVFAPFLIITFGFGLFIFNGIIMEICSPIFGFHLYGFGIIVAPMVVTGVTTFLSAILTIDDDSSYYRAVLRDAEKKQKSEVKPYPGLIIIEIDGLSYPSLLNAINRGYMDNVKKLIDSGSHKLKMWETDFTSQTGTSQAGILHGNNKNIIAFRWVEKENNNRIVQCSDMADIMMLEERISNGNGLLNDNGASRSNLFSGDSNNVIFTSSKFKNIKKLYNSAWFSIYSNPNFIARLAILGLHDLIRELKSQRKHKKGDIYPTLERDFKYASIRVGTNVFMGEINTSTLIGDMMVGDVDIAYSTYLGYDEIAHHNGIDDEESYFALQLMDKHIKRLVEANKYSKRDYKFVIQSDHGQSRGATFTQRYGETFEEFIKSLLPEDMSIYANLSSQEDHHTEVFNPFSHEDGEKPKDDGADDSQVIVLASGNLSMIYLTQWTKRLTYEELNEWFPQLIPGILNNEYVGFVLVKSKQYGDIVISKNGKYFIDEEKFQGENPLKNYGKNILKQLKRYCTFKYLPDVLVMSFYDPKTDEVCAFEELIGSHGGVGGAQTESFIMYPSNWDVEDDIVGSEKIYSILKENSQKLKRDYN